MLTRLAHPDRVAGGLDAGWFAHAAPGDGGRGGWRDSGGSGGDRYWECDNRKPAETAAGVMVPVSDRITPPHNLRDRDRYRSAGAVTYGVAGRAPPHPRGGVGVEVPWQKILDKAFDVSAEAETAGGGSDAGGAGARITAVECGRAGLQVPAPVAAVAAAASLTSPTKQAVSTTFHDNARTMPPDSRCVATTATLLDSTCAKSANRFTVVVAVGLKSSRPVPQQGVVALH